jgi:PAS domain S-box-containing protein
MARFSPEDGARMLVALQTENADLHARLAITEAAEKDPLRVREQRAFLLIKEMCQAVVLLDTQGVILETNQAGLDPVALRRESRIGHLLWEPSSWSGSCAVQNQVQGMFQHAIATGELVRQEIEIPAPGDGAGLMVIDISFKPLCEKQGEFTFVLFEGRDITERKRAEEQVARKNVELQGLYEQVSKLDQLKSLFFAMMNHELRTPLTLILGPTEALCQQPALASDIRQVLDVVTRNGRLLLKLVNDLLEVSRLEAGQLHLNYTSCDLSRLVQLLAANFDTVATERRLTYRVQTPSHLLVEIDAAQIERVLLNLLSNAFKFTPDGGSITCSLEMLPFSRDQDVSTSSPGVALSVQDSGPGIPAALREMIFERFRQTEEGAKRRFGGTGLGLAIVKDLVELHQGSIQVDEAPGGGARFTIHLPQHAPEGTHVHREDEIDTLGASSVRMTQATVEELQPTGQARSETPLHTNDRKGEERSLVLVVEDHAQMRQFLSEQLSSHYRVAEAANGQEGLALARQLYPDLILTDMMMPIMSGEEMLIALRADPMCATIPVVVLSARGNEEHRLSLLRAGAQDYLVKPFSPEELQVRLGNLLVLHRTRRLLQQELASSQQNVENLARALAIRMHDLEALNTELEHMNKQQGNFVAVVSHEFRTALTGIQGFSELLSEQEWSPEEVKEYATDITTDVRRLTRMINDVLDLERMKSEKATLLCEPVDINTLLREVVAHMQLLISKQSMTCVLDDALPLIQGNRDQLIQVLSNLLSNAVKYSPAGGAIVLRSQHEQDSIQISVQDQGIGIPEEAQKDIFMPYNRIASEQTRYIGGTGLGLSVVHEIIHLHGGTIWVESTVGRGSTFHFSLPISQETQRDNA